jgi:hypothetical protein
MAVPYAPHGIIYAAGGMKSAGRGATTNSHYVYCNMGNFAGIIPAMRKDVNRSHGRGVKVMA